MKRIICVLLCAVALLSGCGREEPVPTTEPLPPTEAPTRPVVEVELEQETEPLKYEGLELQYWSMLEQSAPETQVLQQAADYFEATTGARVVFNFRSGNEDLLAQDLAADVKIDLFEVSGKGLVNHLNDALDLTDLAGEAQYETKSWEVLRTQIQNRCGSLKALALRPQLYGMYYNREVFDALGIEATPYTWEEYLTFCQSLKDRGYECLVIDQERAHLILELHMERALGWEGLRDTMIHAQWRKNEMSMTMIQAAIQFAEDGYLVKANPATYPAGQNRLAQSNALMVAGSNVLCSEVEQACLTDMKWGVFPYPGDGPGTGLLVDAQMLAVHASSAAPEAAFEFAMLLASGEFDQLRADMTLGIPADPANASPITGANSCMAAATPQAPKYFTPDNNELFARIWSGWYKTGAYFANQLNGLAKHFAHEKTVG